MVKTSVRRCWMLVAALLFLGTGRSQAYYDSGRISIPTDTVTLILKDFQEREKAGNLSWHQVKEIFQLDGLPEGVVRGTAQEQYFCSCHEAAVSFGPQLGTSSSDASLYFCYCAKGNHYWAIWDSCITRDRWCGSFKPLDLAAKLYLNFAHQRRSAALEWHYGSLELEEPGLIPDREGRICCFAHQEPIQQIDISAPKLEPEVKRTAYYCALGRHFWAEEVLAPPVDKRRWTGPFPYLAP